MERFLNWSGIEAKVVKCRSLAFRSRPKSEFYDPMLHICGQQIPFVGEAGAIFLGLPLDLSLSNDKIQDMITTKLDDLCQKVDEVSLPATLKLKLYRLGICPRLNWLLSLADLPLTWIERQAESITTKFLKRWCHLARPANVARLYLPLVSNGLQLPYLSTTYKRCQISRYHLLLTSTDDRVRRLAEMRSNQFNARRSIKFNPFKYISMCSDSSLSGKSLPKSSDKAKQLVQKADNQLRLERAKSCVVQGATFRLPSLENDDTWSLTVLSFSDSVFLFFKCYTRHTAPQG